MALQLLCCKSLWLYQLLAKSSVLQMLAPRVIIAVVYLYIYSISFLRAATSV